MLYLKTEENFFFVVQTGVTKIIGNSFWTIICFWVSPPNYTNLEFMFLIQQSHVQWRAKWNLPFNSLNSNLARKNLEK